jgi:hypothetical protein
MHSRTIKLVSDRFVVWIDVIWNDLNLVHLLETESILYGSLAGLDLINDIRKNSAIVEKEWMRRLPKYINSVMIQKSISLHDYREML